MAFFFFFMMSSLRYKYTLTLKAFLYHFLMFSIKPSSQHTSSLSYDFHYQSFMLYFLSTLTHWLIDSPSRYNLDPLYIDISGLLFPFFYSFLFKLLLYFIDLIIEEPDYVSFLVNKNLWGSQLYWIYSFDDFRMILINHFHWSLITLIKCGLGSKFRLKFLNYLPILHFSLYESLLPGI